MSVILTPARAQENPVRLPALNMVHPASNGLQFPGGHAAWDRYHAKLDELLLEGQGQVHIAHFGGSHVQADMWSMELRHRFQSAAPGVRAGRGFIFPFNLAKSNNPWWYVPEATGRWTGLRNVVRTDSSALGMLLLLRQFAGGDGSTITLAKVRPEVAKILAVASFGKLFKVA